MPSFVQFDPQNRTEMELLLARLLIIAGEQTERAGDQVIFGKFDLNVSRFSLLMSLARAPRPLTMTEVKDFMVRSPSNLTQMVDNLEQRRLLRRVPREGDRRVNLLELTAEGRELLIEVQEVYKQTMHDFLQSMSSDQLNAMLLDLTDIIRGMLQLQGVAPPNLREA